MYEDETKENNIRNPETNTEEIIEAEVVEVQEKIEFDSEKNESFQEGIYLNGFPDEKIVAQKDLRPILKIIIASIIVGLVGGISIGIGFGLIDNYFDDMNYENTYYLEKSDPLQILTTPADLIMSNIWRISKSGAIRILHIKKLASNLQRLISKSDYLLPGKRFQPSSTNHLMMMRTPY